MKRLFGLGMMIAFAFGTGALTATAAAEPPCGENGVLTGSAEPGGVLTCTYETVGEDFFDVPPRVGTLTVVAIGARGGTGLTGDGFPAPPGVGGLPARVVAQVPVDPGTTLFGLVGGMGANLDVACEFAARPGGPGGFNGGGDGGPGRCVGFGGAGGGGATDLRVTPASAGGLTGGSDDPRLVVAGGGGGGGSSNATGAGDGGAAGTDGAGAGDGGACGEPGQNGGIGPGGGAGGIGDILNCHLAAQAGQPGEGGTGGDGNLIGVPGGGGGGGGFTGGGGGAAGFGGGGGGGGSSHGPAGSAFSTADPSEEASLTVSWTVPKRLASLTAQASSATELGGEISDSAELSEGFDPGGEIAFRLYGPDDTDCSRPPVHEVVRTVTGNGPYGSGPFVPVAAGTYRWTVSYSGDDSNEPASTACDDPGQSVVVSSVAPPPCEKPATPKVTNYLPPFRAKGRYVLGVRARTTVPEQARVRIRATLLFRSRGKARSRLLGSRTFRAAGTRRFRFVLPPRLRKKLHRRQAVRLRLDSRATSDCGATSRRVSTLRTRIVRVLASG